MKFFWVTAAVLVFAALNMQARNGNFVQTGFITQVDQGADGIVDSTLTRTNFVDARGLLLGAIDRSVDGDGNLTSLNTTTFTWANKNRVLTEVDEFEYYAADFKSRTTTTWDYSDPKSVRAISLQDTGADGTVDSETLATYTYDRRTGVEHILDEFDDNLDGIPDGSFTITISNSVDRLTRTQTYTSSGDYDDDGIADWSSTDILTIDRQGDITSDLGETYDSTGVIMYTSTTNYRYDAKGNLMETKTDTFYPSTGSHDLMTTTYFYIPRAGPAAF